MTRKKILMLLGSVCLALVLAVPLVAGCAAPTPPPTPTPTPTPAVTQMTLIYATPYTLSDTAGQAAALFKKCVEEGTDGRVRVDLRLGGSLLSQKELLDGVKAGIADVVYINPCAHPSKTPLQNFGYAAFLGPPRADQQALMWNELAKTPQLIKEFDRWNAVYGGTSTYASGDLMSTKAVTKCEDFDGLKVRCSVITGQTLEKFGASPMMIPCTEVYTSMDTGLIDAVVFPKQTMDTFFISEIATYFIDQLGFGGATCTNLINKDAWNKLPSDAKEAIKSYYEYDLIKLHSYFEDSDEMQAKYDATFVRNGIEVIHFPPEERAKLLAGAEALWDEYAEKYKEYGAVEFLATVISVTEKILAEYPDGMF